MAGLQVGQALRCSCCLGLGSAVPVPKFLGTQPPYVTKALNFFLNLETWKYILAMKVMCEQADLSSIPV